jgi:hypothetical protein
MGRPENEDSNIGRFGLQIYLAKIKRVSHSLHFSTKKGVHLLSSTHKKGEDKAKSSVGILYIAEYAAKKEEGNKGKLYIKPSNNMQLLHTIKKGNANSIHIELHDTIKKGIRVIK